MDCTWIVHGEHRNALRIFHKDGLRLRIGYQATWITEIPAGWWAIDSVGLGLSITYQIIQEHGGHITPHSAGANLGSTFTVSLPIQSHEQKTNNQIAA